MANVARPPVRAPSDDAHLHLPVARALNNHPNHPNHPNHSNTTLSTRLPSTTKASNVTSLGLGDDERPVKQIKHSHSHSHAHSQTQTHTHTHAHTYTPIETKAPPNNRTSSRRPPTKIAVTQPHGELLAITNGVSAPGVDADDVQLQSGQSTPRPSHLQSQSQSQSQDKRSLRSHDGGSRLKSDLAVYFSSYDDIIAGVPKPVEFLDFDTPIYIVDEPAKARTPAPPTATSSPQATRASTSPVRSRKRKASLLAPHDFTCPIPPAPSSTTYQVLDYTSISKTQRHDVSHDPLADAFFFTQHRRAERKEKQLRNIEKERAMHEKVQLERLLDGLQGPDWLKVMGITGVTEGERKDWEPKRTYFVNEVEALVDKFRVWKEEEKRLRAEKEALAAREEEASSASDQENDHENDTSDPDTITVNGRSIRPSPRPKAPPLPRRPPRPHGFLLPYIPPEPATPFHSFYAKPHQRAAALGKNRHGRGALAFGCSIPEFDEQEFSIPEDFVDCRFLRDNARQRRRRRREKDGEGNGG
ncbi:something about silencing, SAS, complex subunit 4-domain-containing protein [Phaeosphaeriaceae sp. PMI808]|nr:something about silencing, SAS, complex subunit 4-domain-containing protein [Phaeosphaeriaceae sp. PMI808]